MVVNINGSESTYSSTPLYRSRSVAGTHGPVEPTALLANGADDACVPYHARLTERVELRKVFKLSFCFM